MSLSVSPAAMANELNFDRIGGGNCISMCAEERWTDPRRAKREVSTVAQGILTITGGGGW